MRVEPLHIENDPVASERLDRDDPAFKYENSDTQFKDEDVRICYCSCRGAIACGKVKGSVEDERH